MSELTTCNRCNLARMRREAIRKKKRVTVVPAVGNKLGGFEVYMHPRSVQIKNCNEEDKKRFWVSWMMEISEKCVC